MIFMTRVSPWILGGFFKNWGGPCAKVSRRQEFRGQTSKTEKSRMHLRADFWSNF